MARRLAKKAWTTVYRTFNEQMEKDKIT